LEKILYISESEKKWNRLPGGQYNRDWKLGFIVTLSCINKAYFDSLDMEYELTGIRSRSRRVTKKREIEKKKKEFDNYVNSISDFIKSKTQLISDRCPDDISLYGVKICSISQTITYDFAFIYKAYLD
jgi:hypothetical protein